MNNNHYPSYQQIPVNGFCLGSPELLMQIREYFGLLSELPYLKLIQEHFARVQRREPLSDELALIDCYLNESPRKAGEFVITSLTTDDPRVAETYEELRFKLSELEPKKALPLNLDELSELGNLCLSAVGRRPPSKLALRAGSQALLDVAIQPVSDPVLLRANRAVLALNTASDVGNALPTLTDCLIYVSPSDAEKSPLDFAAALASMIMYGKLQFTVGNLALTENGFLSAFLKVAKGGFFDMSVLPEHGSVRDLVKGMRNGALLTVSGAASSGFVALAGRYGLDARICGRTDNFARVSIATGFGLPMTVSTDFLRTFRRRYALAVEIPTELPTRTRSNTFFASGMRHSQEECGVAKLGERCVSVVASPTSSYADTVWTLIGGVSELVAAGADYRRVVASVDASFELEDSSGASHAVASLLALYRVQSELCLTTVGSRCHLGEESFGAAFAARLASPLPDRLTSSNSRVYLLMPRVAADGMPEFAELRRLYSYLNECIGDGRISAARAVGRDGVVPTLTEFIGEERTLQEGATTLGFADGGFIVESKTELDGVFLGFSE